MFKVKICKYNPKAVLDENQVEIVELTGKYVGEALEKEIHHWSNLRAYVIQCQTGTGKTTFSEDILVADAIAKGKKTVLVSNRFSTCLAGKKRIMEKYDIKNKWNDQGLMEQYMFGKNIIILTYQKLFNILDSLDVSDVEYVVFDEIHYLLADANFSRITGLLLNKIPEVFKDSKRVYISATVDEVLPYIYRAETNRYARAKYKLNHMLNKTAFKCDDIFDPMQTERVIKEALYAPNSPTPVLYRMRENYKYLNIKFFKDFEIIKNLISESKEKWVVFVNSKDFGRKLCGEFSSALYIDADTKEEDYGKYKNLIDTEKFEEKLLVCTSVFVNGNNIKDSKVRNIVIFNENISDIKQAIGRIRIEDKKTAKLNVYLAIPEASSLNFKINEGNNILIHYYNAQEKENYLHEIFLNNDQVREKLKNIVWSTKEGKYMFNYLSIQKIINDNLYMSEVLQKLDKNGKPYCKYIAKAFSLPFKEAMCELLVDGRKEIEKVLDEYVDKSPLSVKEFEEASKKISRLRKKYGFISKDNFGANRQPLGVKATNVRLAEFNFKYTVEKTNDKVYIRKI